MRLVDISDHLAPLFSEKQDEETSEKKRPLSRMLSRDGHTLSKKLSDVKAAFKMQRFTVHILCEHDEVEILG